MSLRLLMLLPIGWTCLMHSACTGQDQQNRNRNNAVRLDQLVNRLFQTNDTDSNGQISKDEASDRVKNRFERMDTDEDGFLDREEVTDFLRRIGSQRQAAPNADPRNQNVPDNVKLHEDIAYRDGNEKWKLDLYLPLEENETPRAAIVFVHGGGWRSGDKGGGQWRSLPYRFAAKGYVCISINYRLTDEATFPACIEDCKCAVRWLRAHAKDYNVDPARIGAYGNSAGAHLVSMLGLAGPGAELEGDGPFLDQSSMVQAVCCSATPSDFTNWGDLQRQGGGAVAKLMGEDGATKDRLALASPVTHAHKDAPPFLIVHGTSDRTVPVEQGDALEKALKDASAKDVTYLKIDGAGHGVFGQHAKETYPAMETFFERTLKEPRK